MWILAVITEPGEVKKTLRHLVKVGRSPQDGLLETMLEAGDFLPAAQVPLNIYRIHSLERAEPLRDRGASAHHQH